MQAGSPSSAGKTLVHDVVKNLTSGLRVQGRTAYVTQAGQNWPEGGWGYTWMSVKPNSHLLILQTTC